MARDTDNRSYWNATAPRIDFPALEGDHAVDVAIVGGGMVGVTTARLLKDRGLTVALVEARRIGEEVTGKSTAKVTSQHNIVYTTIARKFGRDSARLYAEANQAGLDLIAELCARQDLDCQFERRPAYVYTRDSGEIGGIEDEVELARELGLPASLTTDTGLPFAIEAAMRWDDQAQFHPVKYAKGLAATVPGGGCHVFERSRVTDWSGEEIATETGRIKARHVVMATHLPLGQIGLFHARTHPHMHPVIMGKVGAARVPPGMYLSVETPRHSTRVHRDESGQSWMIFTGPSFRHGHVEEEREAFAEIEGFANRHFGVRPDYRWTNEDYTPMDHVPFVGRSSSGDDALLVATGFNAWGITNGAAAAMMIADLVTGRDNPWLELFDARRIKPIAGAAEFAKGAAQVATHLFGGYLGRKPRHPEALKAGEGAVMKVDGKNVAAYRDEAGALHMRSAVCTHMGCVVGWNETDRTWDCPCHGSRFEVDGTVLHGPAVSPLAALDEEESGGAGRVEEVAGAEAR
jgi:glycine/D-amino acid oxidase-like deaminating enzyme/nitrite reductase/ring-hydroxylating ferredoxin subunit